MAQRIRIRLKAFDHVVLDQAAGGHRAHGGEDRAPRCRDRFRCR